MQHFLLSYAEHLRFAREYEYYRSFLRKEVRAVQLDLARSLCRVELLEQGIQGEKHWLPICVLNTSKSQKVIPPQQPTFLDSKEESTDDSVFTNVQEDVKYRSKIAENELRTELEELELKMKRLGEQLQNEHGQRKDLKREHEKLKITHKACLSKMQICSSEMEALKNENDKQRKESMKLESSVENLEAQLVQARNTIQLRLSDIDHLQSDIKKYQATFVEKSMESLDAISQHATVPQLTHAVNSLTQKIHRLHEKKLKDASDQNVCQICFSEPRQQVLFPCKHFALCTGCMEQVRAESSTCPICREKFTSAAHIFFS